MGSRSSHLTDGGWVRGSVCIRRGRRDTRGAGVAGRSRNNTGAWFPSRWRGTVAALAHQLTLTLPLRPNPSSSSLNPGVELGAKRINGTLFVVQVPMNRHPFAPLPTLHGRDVTL